MSKGYTYESIRSQVARRYNDEINELKAKLNSKEAENASLRDELEKYKGLDLQLTKLKIMLSMDSDKLSKLLTNVRLYEEYGSMITSPMSLTLDGDIKLENISRLGMTLTEMAKLFS